MSELKVFNIEKDINWKIFNKEEKELIIIAFNNGHHNLLTQLPNVNIDTPDKEKEIDKIVVEMTELEEYEDSETRKELDKFRSKGERIETPDDEAKWQEKLDKEKEAQTASLEDKKREMRGEEPLPKVEEDENENLEDIETPNEE